MRADQLEYDLPAELIAQRPAEPRDSARLLVCDRATAGLRHRSFRDLPGELRDGDLLVVNDTRVLPVRVLARRVTGGAAEALLLEPRPDGTWEALVRPYRRLREGERLDAGALGLTVVERLGEGRAILRPDSSVGFEQALELSGRMPLPPYIHGQLDDPEQYQTVYARHPGSAAAPTAGLHFTPELLERLRERHELVEVTLGVGLDTFRPLSVDDLALHEIHSEPYHVSPEAAAAIERARGEGRRVVAVGTTSVRVLETVFGEQPAPLEGRTRLFITPGHRFAVVGAMVTNFHLPRSTLLALVMAFAGIEQTRELYRTAVAERYRFYSFGDACLIV